jgi:hypothetical protein
MMSDTVARPRDGVRAMHRPAKIDRAGVTPRQY